MANHPQEGSAIIIIIFGHGTSVGAGSHKALGTKGKGRRKVL
jgi:hypothetical protein